jgi:hypothetical protein
MRKLLLALACLGYLSLSAPARAAKLHEETLRAWETYQRLTEARIERELASKDGFLVRDFLEARERQQVLSEIRSGVFVREMETRNEEGAQIEIPKGLVHHWYGTTFIPGATLEGVLAWVQDYDRHQEYFQDIEDSRLLSRQADVFDVSLRLRRKKIVTVYYNTEHQVSYRRLGGDRAASRSVATRIAEIEHAGRTDEREKPVGEDRGFLWRLNSYWRFLQERGGVVVECESMSLSRGIPFGFFWVRPIIKSVAREVLRSLILPLRTAFEKAAPTAISREPLLERGRSLIDRRRPARTSPCLPS